MGWLILVRSAYELRRQLNQKAPCAPASATKINNSTQPGVYFYRRLGQTIAWSRCACAIPTTGAPVGGVNLKKNGSIEGATEPGVPLACR